MSRRPCLLLLLVFSACKGGAAQPVLQYPTEADKVYASIPYFEWSDAVAHPFPGDYEIEIANEKDAVCADKVPACISWYSAAFELAAGRYHWRIRYIDPKAGPQPWTEAVSFEIREPAFVLQVDPQDDWDAIKAKYKQVTANSKDGAKLLFPPNHVFRLVHAESNKTRKHDRGDGLFDGEARNVVLDGNGSTLVFEKGPDIHGNTDVFCMTGAQHVQIKNFTIDFDRDSLQGFGGQIVALDKARREITVQVDPKVYPKPPPEKEEGEDASSCFFLSQDTQQYLASGGSFWDMNKSWTDSAIGSNQYRFKITSLWPRIERNLKVGDYCVTGGRGGNIFIVTKSRDIVMNNVTVLNTSGRYFIPGIEAYTRCINNQFVRSGGRLLGATSGGINCGQDLAWFEGNRLEYTRDDTAAIGHVNRQQCVFRNNTINGGVRAAIWWRSDRSWVEGNHMKYVRDGITAPGHPDSRKHPKDDNNIDVAVIRNNVIEDCLGGFNITSGGKNDYATGEWNQYLTITGNTIKDDRRGSAFRFTWLKDSIISDNVILPSTIKGFDPYSSSDEEIGFSFANCQNVSGTGNRCLDQRYTPQKRIGIGDQCKNVTVKLLANTSAEQSGGTDALPRADHP